MWRGAFIVELFVRAGDHWPGFQIFLDQVFAATARALFRDRLACRGELALRIIRAAIERVALARALLDEVAVFALRTLHADEVLLDVLALGISAARGELAETAMTDHHIASAFRAKLVERNIRNFLALIETARSLAVGIARTGHELAEATAFQHHHTATILAVFFGSSGLLHVSRIEIGQVDGIFFGELAGVRIIFLVR